MRSSDTFGVHFVLRRMAKTHSIFARITVNGTRCVKLHHDYTYLANLFSEVQGITIEKFFISHKIERVKELLVYNELTLTEIAYKMHYSSVAHLCTQFKKADL